MTRPVLIVFSILAGAQVVTSGALLGDVVGPQVAGVTALLVAAVQVGMTFYVQGQVTPFRQVAAMRKPDGSLVAGPAAPGLTVEGEIVDVTTDPPVDPDEPLYRDRRH